MENSEQNRPSMFFFALFVVIMLMTYKITVWDQFFAPKPIVGENPAAVGATTNVAGSTGATLNGVTTTGQTATNSQVPAAAGTQAIAGSTALIAPATSTASASLNHAPSNAELSQAGTISVQTASIHAVISKLGGRLLSLKLNDYGEKLGSDAPRLELVEVREQAPYPLGVYASNVDDTAVAYSPVEVIPESGLSIEPAASQILTLRGTLSNGKNITKTFVFDGLGYFINVSVAIEGSDAPMELEWTKVISKESPSWLDHYGTSGYVWYDGDRAKREIFSKVPDAPQDLGQVSWVALSEKFFSSAIIAKDAKLPARAIHDGDIFRSRVLAPAEAGQFRIFAGPNSYPLLKKAGGGLELMIDFGRLMFLCAPLLSLLHFFYGIFANYGLAIVALTIVVKMALLPLTAASFRSMAAMQDIQPEVARLRETVTDKQQQQVQLMELYKKKGVNPLGGCLPMLLQLPIFLGLYSALNLSIELRHADFALWINDLSAMENLRVFGIRLPMMVILLTLSMLIQQWTTPSTMDPTQKKVMMFMPLMFGFMFMNFPAGLTLYWLVSNIISIGQTKALRGKKYPPLIVTGSVCVVTFLFAFVLTKL